MRAPRGVPGPRTGPPGRLDRGVDGRRGLALYVGDHVRVVLAKRRVLFADPLGDRGQTPRAGGQTVANEAGP
jgi:hypothetical protein